MFPLRTTYRAKQHGIGLLTTFNRRRRQRLPVIINGCAACIVMAGGDTHRKSVAHGIQHFQRPVITSGPIPSPAIRQYGNSSTSHGFLVVFVVLSFALQLFSTSAARQILFSTCTMALAEDSTISVANRRRGSGDRCSWRQYPPDPAHLYRDLWRSGCISPVRRYSQ